MAIEEEYIKDQLKNPSDKSPRNDVNRLRRILLNVQQDLAYLEKKAEANIIREAINQRRNQ